MAVGWSWIAIGILAADKFLFIFIIHGPDVPAIFLKYQPLLLPVTGDFPSSLAKAVEEIAAPYPSAREVVTHLMTISAEEDLSDAMMKTLNATGGRDVK